MELPAPPRSSVEVDFFVDETPCERCGKRGVTQARPSYQRGSLTAQCAHCDADRVFTFPAMKAFENAPLWHLGPVDQPSTLFGVDTFRAVADRELALVPADPAELPTMHAWTWGRAHLGKARVALNELAKFRPDDSELDAEIRHAAELYGQYDRAKAVIDARPGAHPAPTGLDGRFSQHRAWLKRGRVGDGQLVFRDEEWSRFAMTTNEVTAAMIEDTTFNEIDFSFSVFREATLRRARFRSCNLLHTDFEGAVLERCDFTDSRLGLVTLTDVMAAGGDWRRITAGRSKWRGRFLEIDLRDASLRDSVMDGASFDRVDLRGADVSRLDPVLRRLGTARGARFVDCDLRGLNVAGWRLDGTVFERCRMHGLAGTPTLEGDVQIIDCDLTEAGDGGADAVGGARLLASWRKSGAS